MRFRNTINGYEETASMPFLWCLLGGPIYFIYRGVWRHVLLYLIFNGLLITIAGILTGGLGFLAYSAMEAAAGSDPGNALVRMNSTIAIVAVCIIIPFLIYPFLATGIIRRHYLRLGWEEID